MNIALKLYLLLTLCTYSGCGGNKKKTHEVRHSEVIYHDTLINLGKIGEKDSAEMSFGISCTSDVPFVVHKVQPTCGCTIAEKPKTCSKGDTVYISATFDPTGQEGLITKSILVYGNTKPKLRILKYEAFVIK